MNPNDLIFGFAAVMAVVFLVFLVLFFISFRLGLQALLTGTPVSIIQIIAMRLRGTPAKLVLHAAIALRQRGETITVEEVERSYLARGLGNTMTATELADLAQELKRKTDASRPDA